MSILAAETISFDPWSTFAGALITAGVGLLAAAVRYWYLRPKLELMYREGQFGRLETTERSSRKMKLPRQRHGAELMEVTAIDEWKCVYVRLSVRNVGRRTAIRCRGFLIGIEKETSAGKFEQRFFDSMPLCWSYVSRSDPQAIDIPAGPRVNLDLLSTREGSKHFVPRVTHLPTYYEFDETGRFRLSIAVVSENAAPQTFQIIVNWNGDWNSFTLDRVPAPDVRW